MHSSWFDKGCSKLLDQRKQDKLNNVRHKASRYFRNKKGEYLKDKINKVAMNSKNKNIRDLHIGTNGFKRGYQLRNNLVKDENGDQLADSRNILNKWNNYFSQSLNVHIIMSAMIGR
jgi:hypothetical protein